MIIIESIFAAYCFFGWGYALGNLVGDQDHGLTNLGCIVVVVGGPAWLFVLACVNAWIWLVSTE